MATTIYTSSGLVPNDKENAYPGATTFYAASGLFPDDYILIEGTHTTTAVSVTTGTHIGVVDILASHTATAVTVTRGTHTSLTSGSQSKLDITVTLGSHVGAINTPNIPEVARRDYDYLELPRFIDNEQNIDATVVKIPNTGDSSVVAGDRYRHRISHQLNRVPVEATVVYSDAFTQVKVISADEKEIIVQFDQPRALVHLRIW